MYTNIYTRSGEMFTKIGLQSAENSDGFSVEFVKRNKLEYHENSYLMLLETEAGIDKQKQWCTIIYTSTITHWQPPHENEVITEEKKQQIIKRICAALDFLEIKYILE